MFPALASRKKAQAGQYDCQMFCFHCFLLYDFGCKRIVFSLMEFHLDFHESVLFSPKVGNKDVWNTIGLFWMNALLHKYCYFAGRK